MDDFIFSYHAASGPESSATLCYRFLFNSVRPFYVGLQQRFVVIKHGLGLL